MCTHWVHASTPLCSGASPSMQPQSSSCSRWCSMSLCASPPSHRSPMTSRTCSSGCWPRFPRCPPCYPACCPPAILPAAPLLSCLLPLCYPACCPPATLPAAPLLSCLLPLCYPACCPPATLPAAPLLPLCYLACCPFAIQSASLPATLPAILPAVNTCDLLFLPLLSLPACPLASYTTVSCHCWCHSILLLCTRTPNNAPPAGSETGLQP